MPVEDRFIFLISKVCQKLITTLQKSFSESGIEVTPIQVMLLFFLQQNDGLSLTQISQGLMLENPTVTGLIDRLEKSGDANSLITRRTGVLLSSSHRKGK